LGSVVEADMHKYAYMAWDRNLEELGCPRWYYYRVRLIKQSYILQTVFRQRISTQQFTV